MRPTNDIGEVSERGRKPGADSFTNMVLDPPQQVLIVQATADCAVLVSLGQSYSSGAIKFYCEGITTTLPLLRTLPAPQRNNGVKR